MVNERETYSTDLKLLDMLVVVVISSTQPHPPHNTPIHTEDEEFGAMYAGKGKYSFNPVSPNRCLLLVILKYIYVYKNINLYIFIGHTIKIKSNITKLN